MAGEDEHEGSEARPLRIGPYTVLRVIGSGAMGVVYSAYDERLDRKIAVKHLHLTRGDGTQGEARMLREAQALARVSHPNVVQVYEVGEHQREVYIAMEFVPGRTLRAWSRAQVHPWREVLEVYLQAGRGLAAAHAAGVVHRDFKPESGRFFFRTPSSREMPRISSLGGVGGKIGYPGLTLHAPG